jgi:hypothetical protein
MARPEDSEAVRQSLEQHKQQLRLAVQDLGVAARSWGDPSGSIRRHPGAWLLGAFAFGLWLGRDGR